MDDQELQDALGRWRSGDDEAFTAIWCAFQPQLRRVAWCLAGASQADDVAMAVWADVVRSRDEFHGGVDDFRGWLFAVARRRLLANRRRQPRRPRPSVDGQFDRHGDSDPEAGAVPAETTEAALALIGSLPPDEAEVVALRVVAGLDLAAVAHIIDKETDAVRELGHRGLDTLRSRLAGADDLEAEALR